MMDRNWFLEERQDGRVDFSGLDLAAIDLSGLAMSSLDFSSSDLRGADLRGSVLRHCDFSDADMRGVELGEANLCGAKLYGTKLDYIPKVRDLDRRMASKRVLSNLNMLGWHCGTMHCRAGWAIEMAGSGGYELESRLGPATAGALIYAVSSAGPVPDFYADNETAKRDILQRAKRASQAVAR